MKTKSPSHAAGCHVAVGAAGGVEERLERINNMKLQIKVLVAALALASSAAYLVAQDGGQPPHRRQGNMGGQPGESQRPPVPPLIAALDTNHNGVIDATEIDNAPAALRTLDKNGDGQLTMDELRPPRPQGGRGGPGGPGGRGRGPMGPPDGQDSPPPGDAPAQN